MATIKCTYCGDEKFIKIHLRDYIYKKIIRETKQTCYFCSYECMRKSERENPNKYCEKSVYERKPFTK